MISRWMRGVLVGLALASALLALPAEAQGKRLALVIGNQDYPSQPGVLSNPHADAERIAIALETVGFTVTRRFDRTQGEIVDDVGVLSEALTRAGPEAIGFFYYSGHGGSAEVNGQRRNYIMPARTQIASGQQLALRGVPLDQLIDGLSVANAKAVFFVSDACRNTLPWSDAKGGEASKAFNAVAQRSGLFIAFAAADGQTAPDDGYFSGQLAQFITQPGQTADRVFTLALREVSKRRPGEKLPYIADGLTADVCFASCVADGETEAWRFAKSVGTREILAAFLQRYPSGAHAGEARAQLAALAAPPKPAATGKVLARVYFGYDKSSLTPEAAAVLNEAVAYLKSNPNVQVEVQGNTDDRGTREYDLALGARMAGSVRDYLVSQGVAASRISTVSFGRDRPLALGRDESAWAVNRNVAVVELE